MKGSSDWAPKCQMLSDNVSQCFHMSSRALFLTGQAYNQGQNLRHNYNTQSIPVWNSLAYTTAWTITRGAQAFLSIPWQMRWQLLHQSPAGLAWIRSCKLLEKQLLACELYRHSRFILLVLSNVDKGQWQSVASGMIGHHRLSRSIYRQSMLLAESLPYLAHI